MPRCCAALKMAKCCGLCGCSLKSGAYIYAVVNLFIGMVFLDGHFLRQFSGIDVAASTVRIASVISCVWVMASAVILIFGAERASKKMVLVSLALSVIHGIAETALVIGCFFKYGEAATTPRGIGFLLLLIVCEAFRVHGWLVVNSLHHELDSNTEDIESDPGDWT